MENMPKGIGFYNIQTGETRYAQLEAQIQAYINSSDMGINASRDQDFYWRLEPEWVKRVRAFRRDEVKMERLTERNGGQKVTTTQVLYAIYGEQIRAAQERASDNETPFEREYLAAINTEPEAAVETATPEEILAADEANSPDEPVAQDSPDDLKEEAPKPAKPSKK